VTSFDDLHDYVAMPRLSGLRLSPDGTWLAATVAALSPDGKKFSSSIWRICAGDQPAVRLTRSAEGESNPEFLPDGSLLFLSRRPGQAPGAPAAGDDKDKPALWLLPPGGGEARPIVAPPSGVTGLATARDAMRAVLVSPMLPGVTGTDEDAQRRQARSDAGVTAILHESFAVRYWDHDLGPDEPRLLLAEVWPEEAGTGQAGTGQAGTGQAGTGQAAPPRDLTPGPGRSLDEQHFEVSPDGRFVVTGWAVGEDAGERRDDLVVIDCATGERSTLLSVPGFDFRDPHISPDGRWVLCTRETHETYEYPGDVTLVITPSPAALDGPEGSGAAHGVPGGLDAGPGGAGPGGAGPGGAGPVRTAPGSAGPDGAAAGELLAGLDRWPVTSAWGADSRCVYFTADDGGRCPVFRVEVGSGVITKITTDAAAYSGLCPGPDGRYLYALRAAVDSPPTAVRIDTATPGAEPERLAGPAAPPELPGHLTEIVAHANDGVPIRGWLALPAGASPAAPAPLLLWVHGGPLSSWNSWSWRWNPWLMVARGYAVLLPDPALSTGYGRDFIARGHGEWGGRPYTDVMAITDATVARPDVDEARTAVMGGSFGGYMANWIAGHTRRFRAVVSHASLWALDQMFGTTDAPALWRRHFGEPLTQPERYSANSPHLHAANIATPMLVIHGDKDYRVPVGEALRLWTDLAGAKGGVSGAKFLYFPDENHWVLTPGNSVIWYETVLAFLAQHVLGEPWRRPGLL
jgi:dipeptidyl aminopeptidase/acylaminoacyl peptidase